MDLRRFPNQAILIAGILLLTLLIVLIGASYFEQGHLRESVASQARLTLENKALDVEHFFADRRDDFQTLLGDPTINSYFANRALGMSLAYGLRASLMTLRRRLRQFDERKQIGNTPIYRYIGFFDASGEILAEGRARQLGPGLPVDHCGKDEPRVLVTRVDGLTSVVYCQQVRYKHERVGSLVAILNGPDIFAEIMGNDGGEMLSGAMLRAVSPPLSVFSIGSVDAASAERLSLPEAGEQVVIGDGDSLRLRAPVPGAPFMLIGVVSLSDVLGYLSSPVFVHVLTGLALLVMLGTAYLLYLNNHNLALRARFLAAREQEATLSQQNILLQREVSKRISAERRLSHQANYDSLTRLPNRHLVLDRLSQALKRAAREGEGYVLVAFMDLDHFKQVNDTLGHVAGDRLLVQAARRLSSSFRGGDTVARLGGDEFLALCPDIREPRHAEDIAEKLLELFEEPFVIQDHEFYIGLSLGLALYPQDGEFAEQLLKNADLALYQAKDAGRGQFCFFTEAMNRDAHRRVHMEAHLRHAVANNELHLLYQPIQCVKSGRIVAAEALLRWRNDELGDVMPDRFIPLAEDTGIIEEIGAWVLQRACRDAAGWQHLGEVRVAVNLSTRQFNLPQRLLGTVEQALSVAELPAERLELELTESLLLQEQPEVLEALNALHGHGIRLSIDDFGTGYSSMSYLRRYPFDVLKIDRSFMQDIASQGANASLVEAIIAMARALRLEVIAEGVESIEQVQLLSRLDCDLAQGYHYSRPVPLETFVAMLSHPTPVSRIM